LVRPYAFLSEVYFKTKDYDKSLYYAERSYELETNKNANTQTDNISHIQATNLLSKIYSMRKDYKKTHNFLNEYNTVSLKYTEASTLRKIADMQSMFKFEQEINLQKLRQKKDKEIATQQLRNEKTLEMLSSLDLFCYYYC
jgi:hypothetical protein